MRRRFVVCLGLGVGLAACHADDPICLSDSFDDGSLEVLRWNRIGDAPLTVGGGALQLTAPVGLDRAQAGIESIEPIDLTDRFVEVAIASFLPVDAHTTAELAVVPDDGRGEVAFRQSNGVLALVTDGSTQSAETIPIDPAVDRWRIGAPHGMASFEVSGPDTDDRILMSAPSTSAPVSLTSVHVRVAVEVQGVPAQAGTAVFDEVVVDQGACTSPDRYRDHNLSRAVTLP